MLDIVLPHSCAFHPSKACTIPAIRQAFITLLGNQFCHIFKTQTLVNEEEEKKCACFAFALKETCSIITRLPKIKVSGPFWIK